MRKWRETQGAFWRCFTNGFGHVAGWRKAALARQLQARRRSKMRFEALEQRLLLSADLNLVIDGVLDTLNPAVPPSAPIVLDYVADDGVITVGTSVNGQGADIELEGVKLTFRDLMYDNVNACWDGQVGVEAMDAKLFPGSLDVEVSDGDDSDAYVAVGVIDLTPGTAATLHLDDLDAEAIGWPRFLDVNITDLELNFSDFRANDDLNSLHLEVALTGFDTGNDALNDLLSADNPLFGLNVQGAASVEFSIPAIEGAAEAAAVTGDVPTAVLSALGDAMANGLDGLAGSVSGKLFKVGDISAGFIYHKITLDPDAAGPLPEKTSTYVAVEGGFSIGDEVWGGRSTKFDIAFAVSDLGPLQFFISGGPIKRFEPATGLTIEEAHLGVRFNTTIEEMQTETDFQATAATVEETLEGTMVTLTIPDHDLAIGNDFRIRNADNSAYDGEYKVLAVNGDQVAYKVLGDPGIFVGDAEIVRLTITDPRDLSDAGLESGIAPPDDIFVWRDQLDAAVANQIAAGDNIWAQLFGEVVFGGGATLSIDPIPDTALQFKADLMIDTDLRILLAGNLSFLDGLVEFPASLYTDLSDLLGGSARFLLLADIPELPVIDPLLVLRGEVFFEPLVDADLLGALVTPGSGFWDVDLTLALDNPSDEYVVGDHAVIFGSGPSAFDGTYEVVAINDDANTITIRSATDPGAWGSGTARKVTNENALSGGFRIGMEGALDLNIPLVTTLTLDGAVQMDFRVPGPAVPEDLRMDLSFDVALSETHVGNIGSANGNFHVTVDTDIPPDDEHLVGGVEIWGAAVLTTNFEFLENVGLFASASALLRINSSTSEKPAEELKDVYGDTISVALPAESFALRLDGSADFRIDFNGDHSFALSESAFLVEGSFVLEFSAEQGFDVAIFREGAGETLAPATLQLGPTGSRLLTFDVFGFLAIRSNGFAANIVLTADAALPLNLASIDATAVLIVNTTGEEVIFEIPGGAVDPDRSGLSVTIPKAAPTDPSAVLEALSLPDLINGSAWLADPSTPGAPYGVAFLDGSLDLLSVLNLEVSGFILLSPSVVSLEVNFFAAGDFLSLASASASGTLFFSSEGEFVVDVHGRVQLGPDWINIRGAADLTISYLDDNGKASGGDLILALDIQGILSVGATLFGVNIGDLSLGVSYNSNTGNIIVRVPYPELFLDRSCWHTFFGNICIYYPNIRTSYFAISVGTLTAVPDQIPPPPVLGQVDSNGVLTLNVGASAGARNLLIDEVDETVVIDRVGNTIQISMFGQSQTFTGVTAILIADMGDGNDFVDIRPAVTTPLEVHFGDGVDRLRNLGTGAVLAFGDDDDDRLEGGSGDDHLYGGAGDDLIDGGAGKDWIEGGDDGDTLIGGDDADTIQGGADNDMIAGDLAVVEGDTTTAILRTLASALGGSDVIQGGDGADILFGGSGNDTIFGESGDDKVFGDDGSVTTAVNQPDAIPAITLLDLGSSGDDLAIWTVGDGDDTVSGQLGNDTINVAGTDGGSEHVTISGNGSGFTAAVGAETLSVNGTEVSNIDGRRAGDIITIEDLAASVLRLINIQLGTDNVQDAVTVNGSNSGDVFSIAPIADAIRVQKMDGVTLDISGAGTGSGGDTLTVNTEGGADTVNILGTRTGTFTTVNAGSGDDTVNVGGDGTADGIMGLLTINGNDPATGSDVLNIDDSGDTGPTTGALTATTITGLGMGGSIAYGTIETLNIDLGSGADSFTIESTHSGTTRLNTNAGSDTVNVRTTSGNTTVNSGADSDIVNVGGLAPAAGGTLNAIGAPLAITGEDSIDKLNVDDTGDADSNSGVLTKTTLSGLNMAGGITYSAFEILEISLGSGGNHFDITGAMKNADVPTITIVNTGAGSDDVTILLDRATDGPLAVNLQAGENSLDASDSSLDLVVFGGGGSDFIDGGSGADIILGDGPGDPSLGARDVIHGNGGDDIIFGGGGDDEIYGEQGDDLLAGQGGNDVILGDAGQVHAGNVLLTDVASVTGELPLNVEGVAAVNTATVDALLDADLVLLAGRLNGDGLMDSRALMLELVAEGNDILYGGDGDDTLFGQRGNDILNGDAGNDLLAAGSGDDQAYGGTGDDTVVGDELYIDSVNATVPSVTHGLLIDGTVVVPALQTMPGATPNAVTSVLPFVFGYGANSLLPAGDGGAAFLAYASVVTDFAHHLGQVRGDDVLSGGEGNDTLVGDDQIVFSRDLGFDTERMARAEALTRGLLDVSDDFSDLIHGQYDLFINAGYTEYDNGMPLVDSLYSVGADVLDGDDGNDVLIGDDSVISELAFTLPAGLAADFERFTEGVADAAGELAHAVLDLGRLNVLQNSSNLVLLGNDTIHGGNGNDLIIGDTFIARNSTVTVVAGGSTSYFGLDNAWQDSDWKDSWPCADGAGWLTSGLKVGADTISGDGGADLIWGDNIAVTAGSVTRGAGLGSRDFDRARSKVENGLQSLGEVQDSARYWLPLQPSARFDNGDEISGGDGDDIMFGQGGRDTLRGDAGNDWLVGGEGEDNLEGGPGADVLKDGSDSSIDLRSAVASYLINWDDSFRSYGLTYTRFARLGLANGGGLPNLPAFEFLAYDSDGHQVVAKPAGRGQH